jgi:hypothetical protein
MVKIFAGAQVTVNEFVHQPAILHHLVHRMEFAATLRVLEVVPMKIQRNALLARNFPTAHIQTLVASINALKILLQ